MIRRYTRMPMFDDGFDPNYNNQILSDAVAMNDINRIYSQMYNSDGSMNYGLDDQGEAPSFMNMSAGDIVGEPAAKRSNAPVRRSNNSYSFQQKKTTTGALDMAAAQKTYNTSVAAAKKKQTLENKQAVRTLKNNGMSQKEVYDIFNRSAVATGERKRNSKFAKTGGILEYRGRTRKMANDRKNGITPKKATTIGDVFIKWLKQKAYGSMPSSRQDSRQIKGFGRILYV